MRSKNYKEEKKMFFDKEKIFGQVAELKAFLGQKQANVFSLSEAELFEMCDGAFEQGKDGQFHCTTKVRARSVPQTVYFGDSENVRGLSFDEMVRAGQDKVVAQAPALLKTVLRYVSLSPMWHYKAAIGEHPRLRAGANIFVSGADLHSIRLLYMAYYMLPVPQVNEHFQRDFTLVYLPEFQDPAVMVFPDHNLTVVLGSGYFGELKKGLLRMLWYEASFRGIVGLHASTKVVTTREDKRIAVVTLGLSGTGKTSTVMNQQVADGFQAICQDDFVGLDAQSLGVWGTELGFFYKTEGITAASQPEIFRALSDPRTFWENVFVDSLGNPDFCDYSLTKNGRAVTPRAALPREVVSHTIDIPHLEEMDRVVFLMCSRHNTYPVIQKMSSAQFAAAFALGHTTGTSAGGASEAGKEQFVEGTNPFIVRKTGVDSNLLLKGLKAIEEAGVPVDCLILNTGYTGEVKNESGRVIKEAADINIAMCSAVLSAAWQGKLEWVKDESGGIMLPAPNSGLGLPAAVLDPKIAFTGHKDFYKAELERLNTQKREKLEGMAELESEILNAGLAMLEGE